MTRLVLLLALLVLFAPRTVWMVHLADHGPRIETRAVHVHNAPSDGRTGADASTLPGRGDAGPQDRGSGELVHDHSPVELLGFAALPSPCPVARNSLAGQSPGFPIVDCPAPASRSEGRRRPPRNA